MSQKDGNRVDRRSFLAAIPAMAVAPLSSAAETHELAVNGGTPVRTTPLTTEYPGTQFYAEQERTELTEAYDTHSLFRFYGPSVPQKVAKLEQELAAFLGT